jgi:peptide deformylase
MTAKPDLMPQLPADEYALTPGDQARFKAEYDRGMLPAHDPSLSKSVAAVAPHDIASEAIQHTIAHLQQVAYGQRRGTAGGHGKRKRTLVGLAAPQIGEPWRIIMVDTKVNEMRKHYGKLECFINPKILWRSRETVEGREGCFSAGPVWGLVRRPLAVKIEALDTKGRRIERIFEGFTARIICHEIDHLDGIRFPERIKSDAKRHWVHSEEIEDYPDHINHWPRICSIARWEAFKHGRRFTQAAA